MKGVALILPLALLGGCDRAAERTEPVQSPATAAPVPVQTSIMRPEVAAPEPEPSPVEPLELVIGFSEGGDTLLPEEVRKLVTMIGSPQVVAGGPIRLAAHSDSSGSDAANLAASRMRGEAVRDWLIENGIAEERIALVAFGEQNPVRPNALPDGSPDEAGRTANRRVEIRVPMPRPATDEARVPTLAEEIGESSDLPDMND